MTRRLVTSIVLALVVALTAPAAVFTAEPLATYRLGRGWATFGLALPQGQARGAVAVGTLPTQTDVKTRWPDGSIRFAVVTARTPAAGAYPITPAAPVAGGAPVTWPAASVELTIGPGRWQAPLPGATADRWLAGPLVNEARATVTPRLRGLEHPFLRVIFDVRAYADGGTRLDVTVENTIDTALAANTVYDVAITLNGQQVFRKTGVEHKYLARWRHVSSSGVEEAAVTADLRPFVGARALPPYLAGITGPPRTVAGPQFEILRTGDLMVPMNAHGGRPEIAPYPDWTAQYLVEQRPDQRAYVLRHGELAGSFGIHIKEPDAVRLISIDEHPNYWLDQRADPDGRPKSGLRGVAEPGDNAHQPSLAFVPYLITGDRYFLDEMKYWANFTLLWTFQDSYSKQRGGSAGLLASNEVRGIGWALRNLADAAAYVPDNDEMRAYFRQKVTNNLTWLDEYAGSVSTPLGTLFPGRRPEDEQWAPYSWIALWEQAYVAWAVDHAQQHGFGPGSVLRDRIVKLQLRLFTSEGEGFPRTYAGAYVLAVGTKTGSGIKYFNTMEEMFRVTDKYGNHRPFQGYYGPEARLLLMIAMRLGLAGAPAAYQYLSSNVGADGISMTADLHRRSGWAIAYEDAAASRLGSIRAQ
ncbi:MAG: hypothetical protein WC815_20470 [Vicinamibacterales bacterium]|jgi:hypothetical protein